MNPTATTTAGGTLAIESGRRDTSTAIMGRDRSPRPTRPTAPHRSRDRCLRFRRADAADRMEETADSVSRAIATPDGAGLSTCASACAEGSVALSLTLLRHIPRVRQLLLRWQRRFQVGRNEFIDRVSIDPMGSHLVLLLGLGERDAGDGCLFSRSGDKCANRRRPV